VRVRFSSVTLCIFSLGAGVGAGVLQTPAQPTEVVFLSVGQGDCTVFRHAGLTILVDVGPATEHFDAGSRLIAPKLRGMGIDRVDLVFLTHPDSDHIGGLAGLSSRAKFGKVAAPSYFQDHPDLGESLRKAGIHLTDVLWLDRDLTFDFAGLQFDVRLPSYSKDLPDNEGSLLIQAKYKGHSVVLTGDAGEETELRALGRADWSADVLKAGHHGSKGSSAAAWLSEVHPRAVVVSCGRDNRFGHPAPEALGRFATVGAKVIRTDIEGDIRFAMTPSGFVRMRR
jgi:competence protein ComEC